MLKSAKGSINIPPCIAQQPAARSPQPAIGISWLPGTRFRLLVSAADH